MDVIDNEFNGSIVVVAFIVEWDIALRSQSPFGNCVARQWVRVYVFSACSAARQAPATQYRWIDGRKHTKANVIVRFLCDFMYLSCGRRFDMYSVFGSSRWWWWSLCHFTSLIPPVVNRSPQPIYWQTTQSFVSVDISESFGFAMPWMTEW